MSCLVDSPNSVIHLNQTPLLERYEIRCNPKNGTTEWTSAKKRCAQNMINHPNPTNQCSREDLYDHLTNTRIIFHSWKNEQDIHTIQIRLVPNSPSFIHPTRKSGVSEKGNHLRPSYFFTLHPGMEPNARACKKKNNNNNKSVEVWKTSPPLHAY